MVEIPGLWSRDKDNPPDLTSLSGPRPISDYPLAPCRHEYILIKPARHVRRPLEVFEAMDLLQQAHMRASAGQCGTYTAHGSTSTDRDVARMHCPGSIAH